MLGFLYCLMQSVQNVFKAYGEKKKKSRPHIYLHVFPEFTRSLQEGSGVFFLYPALHNSWQQILQTSKFLPMKCRRSALFRKAIVQNANVIRRCIHFFFIRVLPFLLSPELFSAPVSHRLFFHSGPGGWGSACLSQHFISRREGDVGYTNPLSCQQTAAL